MIRVLVGTTATLLLALFAAATPVVSIAAEHRIPARDHDVVIHPIQHAGFVMSLDETTIYVDPFGNASLFEGLAPPTLILVTDIHEDHMDVEALKRLATKSTQIVAPSAVATKLPPEIGYPLGI